MGKEELENFASFGHFCQIHLANSFCVSASRTIAIGLTYIHTSQNLSSTLDILRFALHLRRDLTCILLSLSKCQQTHVLTVYTPFALFRQSNTRDPPPPHRPPCQSNFRARCHQQNGRP
jgi:hypothetical protein